MTDLQLANAVNTAMCTELNESLRRIHNCLDQLSNEDMSWRPNESMNSIANLLLHLCGSARQWVISGVGGVVDSRDRQSEFDDRNSHTKEELLSAIDATVAEVCDVIMSATAEELARTRLVKGKRQVTGALAIIHAIAHFQGHTQEIAHMTRILVGDGYSFAFVPQTKLG